MSAPLIATIIFLLSYAAIATEKINRTVVAFVGALLLLLFKVFTLDKAIGYVSWETMGLLFGMFIIVGALSEAGFFTYLALVTARMLKYSLSKIFIVFPIITGLLSDYRLIVRVHGQHNCYAFFCNVDF